MTNGPVIDVGAGENPDPRATETADVREPADYVFDARGRWPYPDGYASGVILSHVMEHFADPASVLREAARTLEDTGWIEVRVPLGMDSCTDPDHAHRWTYATPKRFSASHRQPWDPELPIRLVSRSVDPRLGGPLTAATPLLRLAGRWWPGWACWNADHGELIARYRRVPREGSE